MIPVPEIEIQKNPCVTNLYFIKGNEVLIVFLDKMVSNGSNYHISNFSFVFLVSYMKAL